MKYKLDWTKPQHNCHCWSLLFELQLRLSSIGKWMHVKKTVVEYNLLLERIMCKWHFRFELWLVWMWHLCCRCLKSFPDKFNVLETGITLHIASTNIVIWDLSIKSTLYLTFYMSKDASSDQFCRLHLQSTYW